MANNTIQAAILIGGMGTRLGDSVRSTPKPLLEVCGRPFVEHVMLNLRRFGFDSFILLAGYKSEIVQAHYGENSTFTQELGGEIKVIVEPVPLGTGGALKYAKQYLQEEFLLINGDSIFDINYLDLARCTRNAEPNNWIGRIALLSMEDASRYGVVALDGTQISTFREKPQKPEPGLINSGVYWLKSEILNFINDGPCSLEQGVFPKLAADGRLVGRSYQGFFIDIGIPEDLERARATLLAGLQKPAAFLDRDGTINDDNGYTYRIQDFRWFKGAKDAIKLLNDAGYLVFIVTNQAGIARGYYDTAAVDTLHRWMQIELMAAGAHFDDIRYCPHHPAGSVPELAVVCDCRKPGAGMLRALIKQWTPLLSRSFMLGDADKDVQAGTKVGLTSKKIRPGTLLKEIKITLQKDAT